MSRRTLLTYYSSSTSGTPTPRTDEGTNQPKRPRVEFRHSDIIGDPRNRKPIEDYSHKIRDEVKRAYALSGPTQPENHTFSRKWQSEYSVSKDAAYCLYCYLFFDPRKSENFGSSVFAKQGYVNWKKSKEAFARHSSCKTHVESRLKCDDFMNQRSSVSRKVNKYSKEEGKQYEIHLTSSLDVARFLIMQGDAFRGHDESSTSLNKGTFRELVDWYKDRVEVVKDAYDNGKKNCQMLSHHIQKDRTKACAEEVMAVIMDEISGRKFSVLIDESRDVSIKEQMAMILRFVNDEGKALERFAGIQHIERCTAVVLKEALGYDGASNTRGEFNGVQKLIKDENPYAIYVHCFAHQLQLVVVTVSISTPAIVDFFNYVPLIVNTVGASCMRKDALLARQHDLLLEKVENGEILTGRGLNQQSSLARPRDTRWGSHLKTLLRILVMWEAIIDVLELVKKDSVKPTCNGGAFGLICKMESFDFVFILHLMIELLSITNMLSRALQRKDQDIVEAMHLIMGNEIQVPDRDKEVNTRGTSAHRRQKVTNKHFCHVEIFLAAVDAILSEMNHRFGEELLSNFDVDKLVRLAEIYAEDFDIGEIAMSPSQLRGFVRRVRRSQQFLGCTKLSQVAEIMVKDGMHRFYPLIYRAFSAMSFIKTDLRNKMGDEWKIFKSISNEKIIKWFEERGEHRMLVPKN
ncbi:hypothetical protein BS78_05G148400 [Paspalum vaginatum]|nr:hypothetical protein BS78_05G148400 [Paspalum vaginatum]